MACVFDHRLFHSSRVTLQEAFQIAVSHHQAGRLPDAEALYRQILAAKPRHADSLHLLGVIASQTGQHDIAARLIRDAIAFAPGAAVYHSNLGEAYRHLGKWDQAIASYQHALSLNPALSEAHNNLGLTLRAKGKHTESIACYERALTLKPDYADAIYNLGNAAKEQGKFDEALAFYRRAVAIFPGYVNAWNNQSVALKHTGRIEEAIALLHHALRLAPHDWEIQSNLLLDLHYLPGVNAELLSLEHGKWNALHPSPPRSVAANAVPAGKAGERLRIGYVSSDLRDHAVGRNLKPLFEHHSTSDFEIHCYSNASAHDAMGEYFRGKSHHWREVSGLSDAALAAKILADGIDVLVDLSQHSAGNRLGVFALSPSPVQVSFAGYPAGTGLAAIRHRISDRLLEGGAARDAYGADEHVHHIDSFWCYDPCGMDVPVQPLPAASAGHITFGCLNNFCKVNRAVIALWASVLGEVQHSRILILSPDGTHRQQVRDQFFTSGIDPMRIEFASPCTRQAYLGLYHRIDISLDTFPYNGHTTSLDSLWMGVPVVSLCGPLPVTRAGLSQLTHLGLPELVADTAADYLRIAMSLASDIPRLLELRSTLRHRMEQSVLMDAPRFARQIEDAYREMWRASLTTGCSTPPA